MRTLLASILLAPLLAACGDDLVNYSAPVGITMKLRSADVTQPGDVVSLSKGITTEQGNPYGAFVNAATRALGRAPSRIAVTSASLELLPSSSGVANLNQVLGVVSAGFDLNSVIQPVCTAANPAGTIVPMAATFDSAGLDPVAYGDLVGGTFPVVLGGTAIPAFASGNDTADLQVTFGFVAYR